MEQASPTHDNSRPDLRKIMGNLQEGVILIEPEGALAWANPAALGMHGVATLRGLGGTVQAYCDAFALKYRNNHGLEARQYPIHRAWKGENFSDVVVELAHPEQDACRVLQMHSVVLDDHAGRRHSVALVITDITEQIEAEQRFEKTFNVNPAPALICRLRDFRYIKVNPGFLDMTGYSSEQVIGRSAYELDVLNEAQYRDEAIASISGNKTIPQMEALLPLPDGGKKYVIVAGQPIEVDDEACMLFTFIDLDLRKQAEDALRESEERFSKAFRLAPVPMLLGTSTHLLEANDAFLTVTGHAREDLDHEALSLAQLWADAQAYRRFVNLLNTADRVSKQEFQLRTRHGAVLDCLIEAESVLIAGQRRVLAVVQDISDYKQSESQLAAAIEAVMQDTSWFSRSLLEKLAQIRRPAGPGHEDAQLGDLTPREREVLGLICAGMSDTQIGAALKLARNTVRNHVATIYSKIGVHRRGQAIIWGRERGIVGRQAASPGRKA